MKKNLKWILIALGAIFIGFIIYIIVKKSLREEAELIFPETVIVENATSLEIEKITKALAFHVLRMDTLKITTAWMSKSIQRIGDMDIKAYVTKNLHKEHEYFIFLSRKLKNNELKRILSHEMIHVRQMEEGNLIQLLENNYECIWKGDTINYYKVPYSNRPQEIEAHKWDNKIYYDLEKIWYK